MKIIEAYIRIIIVFVVLRFRGIRHYAKFFRDPSFSSKPDSDEMTLKSVKEAVDSAVKFMFFNSDCVYQSLVLTMMLRCRNIRAVACLGVSSFPFRAHAWVELEGVVISGDSGIVNGLYPLKGKHSHE